MILVSSAPVIKTLLWFSLLFFLLTLVFSLTAPPTDIGYADSSELVSNAIELSVPHPPGYPLLTLLGHAVIKLIPFANPARTLHIFNAALTALSYTFVVFSLTHIQALKSKARQPSPRLLVIIAICIVSFTPLNWLYAGMYEISGLTKILLSVTLLFFLLWYYRLVTHKRALKFLVLGSLFFGLLLSHYQLAVVLAPAFLFFVWLLRARWHKSLSSSVKKMLLSLTAAAVGFVLPNLILLPINLRLTNYSWYFEPTVSGLIRHVLRQDYSGYFIDQDTSRDAYFANPGLNFFTRQVDYLKHLNHELTPIGLILLAVGVYSALKHRSPTSMLFLALAVLSGPVVAGYMGFPDPSNRMEYLLLYGIGERQLIMHYLTLIPLLSYALVQISTILTSKRSLLLHHSFLFVACAFLVLHIHRSFPAANQSQNYLFEEYAHSVFKGVKPQSVIICASDISCYSLMYHSLTKNSRPDVTLLFKNNLYRRHFIKRYPEFYGFEYQSNPDYYAHLVAWNLMSRPVYLTDPDEYYINYIGLNADPLYLVPTGYVFEVAKDPPILLPEPDYGFTDRLLHYTFSPLDHFGSGLKNYFASLHYLTGIMYANYNSIENSNRHFGLSLSLLPGYPEAAQKLVDLQNFSGNPLYVSAAGHSRSVLEATLSASLEGNYLQTAYEVARKLTLADPTNPEYREKLIQILLEGNYTNDALMHLYYLKLLSPDFEGLNDLEAKVIAASAGLKQP